MCPSTSRGTCVGSQFGICPATAVIRPKVNAAVPSRKRMRSSAERRSLRILRRRRFEPEGALRLRRSKRWSLALLGVPHDDEGGLRGSRRAAGLFLGDHDPRALRNGAVEWNGHGRPTFEEPGGLWRALVGDPCLIGPTSSRGRELVEYEGAPSARGDHQRSACEGDLARSGLSHDLCDLLLTLELGLTAIQLVRQRR